VRWRDGGKLKCLVEVLNWDVVGVKWMEKL